MQSSARRHVEIETLEDFDRRVAQGATSMTGWQLQDVDLRKRGDVLERLDARGALFLGCPLDPDVEDRLRDRGALVFPEVPDVPVNAYRAHLYTPDELYDGLADGSYGSPSTPARTPGSTAHRRRPLRAARPVPARPGRRRRARGARARPPAGRRDGRARARSAAPTTTGRPRCWDGP